MVEVGSEWFHRQSLAVVSVDETEDGLVTFLTADMTGRDHEPDFLRDYARNILVTLELLERMGWDRKYVEDGEGLQLQIGNDCRLYCESGNAFVLELFEDWMGKEKPAFIGCRELEIPAILRDLLVTLRVFGVEVKVPE